jgi:hydroxyacylglutathione hydrolase
VHLADGHNIPLTHLRERLRKFPSDRPVVVHCEGGYRSAIACSLLTQAGRTNMSDMVGGIKAWIATKLPTVPENTMTCGTKICETPRDLRRGHVGRRVRALASSGTRF